MVPQRAPLLLGVDKESDGILGCLPSVFTLSRYTQCTYVLRAVRKTTFCACCLCWPLSWLHIGFDGPLCTIASHLSGPIRRRDTLVDEPLNTPHSCVPAGSHCVPIGRASEGGDADRPDLDQAGVLGNTSSKLICQLSFDLPFGDLAPIRCDSIGSAFGTPDVHDSLGVA